MCFHGDSSQDCMAMFQVRSQELSRGFCKRPWLPGVNHLPSTGAFFPPCISWRRSPPLNESEFSKAGVGGGGEPQCISPYARTESINASRTQEQELAGVQLSSFKTQWASKWKLHGHFFDSKSSQKKKKKRKMKKWKTTFERKGSNGGRDTPDTMYSDIVVFFLTHFQTTVHTSAPLRNLFFTDV